MDPDHRSGKACQVTSACAERVCVVVLSNLISAAEPGLAGRIATALSGMVFGERVDDLF